MKITILCILSILGAIYSCSSNKNTSKTMNCELLKYDELYNHFYESVRETPYSGRCESFYMNGNTKARRIIVNGKNNGPYELFYENGKLKEKGAFKDNLQQGERKLFDETGKCVQTENYYYGQIKAKQ